MKRCTICSSALFCIVFFTDLALTAPPLEEPGNGWTAKEAVEHAIKQNPESQIALERMRQAEAAAKAIQSTDYPLVLVNAEYSQTDNPMYSFGNILNQGAFDDTIDFNDPGTTDNLQLKAEVQYRFYNGGRDAAAKRKTQAEVEIAHSDIGSVHESLSFQVVKTFQAILQAQKMERVRRQAVDAISASLEVGKARYEAGDILKQDLLILELQKARESENLIRAHHQLELAKRSFQNLLGLQTHEFLLNESRDSVQSPPTEIDFNRRYELRKLSFIEKAAEAALDKAKGGSLPTFDGFMAYQFDHGWELNEEGDSWIAGLRLNYTLFDGDRNSSERAMSMAKLNEVRALRKKTEQALRLDIENAKLTYQQAGERLSVTSKIVEVAEEAARLARVRFKEGVILSSDLIDFEMRLTDGQARHLAAKAEYQVAIANLRRATGHGQFSTPSLAGGRHQ